MSAQKTGIQVELPPGSDFRFDALTPGGSAISNRRKPANHGPAELLDRSVARQA